MNTNDWRLFSSISPVWKYAIMSISRATSIGKETFPDSTSWYNKEVVVWLDWSYFREASRRSLLHHLKLRRLSRCIRPRNVIDLLLLASSSLSLSQAAGARLRKLVLREYITWDGQVQPALPANYGSPRRAFQSWKNRDPCLLRSSLSLSICNQTGEYYPGVEWKKFTFLVLWTKFPANG